MEIISTIFYFLVVIGILVFIHEFGHFIAARIFKIRAEIFAFGMGPRLFGYNKVNGFTFGKLKEDIQLEDHTDYRVCAFPIGGFVKVAGMIDESMDSDFVGKKPEIWEYRSRPVWQRMIVILAGVFMNVLLAFIIFYFTNIFKEVTIYDTTKIGYIPSKSIAYEVGLKNDDIIRKINGKEVNNWTEVTTNLYGIDNIGSDIKLEIQRGNLDTFIYIPKGKISITGDRTIEIYPDYLTCTIREVIKEKPAGKLGLKENDIILTYAGEKVRNSRNLTELIKNNFGKESKIEWERDGIMMSAFIMPDIDSTIGIKIEDIYIGPKKYITYNAFTAFTKSVKDLYYLGIDLFFKSIAKIIKGDIPFKSAIGGPIKIAKISAQSAESGFLTFIYFVALLSLTLAIINVLPFPALDGGHFIILLIEAIIRKPISYKVQIMIQRIGLILLIAFMLFVIYNDIISLK
ncbi:MAG: RIP metalloprotease RseP [Ignavibacteria bacterium]|nr:RIP metalloprotease RseP [Ignavibacteria bacterium]